MWIRMFLLLFAICERISRSNFPRTSFEPMPSMIINSDRMAIISEGMGEQQGGAIQPFWDPGDVHSLGHEI